jgi:hypothetical protein
MVRDIRFADGRWKMRIRRSIAEANRYRAEGPAASFKSHFASGSTAATTHLCGKSADSSFHKTKAQFAMTDEKMIVRMATLALICAALAAVLAPHAVAQGCAMCYQNAAASGAKGQAALRHGILILLIPALGIFGSILAVTFRRL